MTSVSELVAILTVFKICCLLYEAFHENVVVEYKTHIYVTGENRKRHKTSVIWKELGTIPEILTESCGTPYISADVGREIA